MRQSRSTGTIGSESRARKIVAEALDDLKRDGYRVFHDVPPEREAADGQSIANFDHVVIGPAGVFGIETKTRSKTPGENTVIVGADGRVLVNGHMQDRCPIKQVKVLARALQTTLERETAMKRVAVQPVVVFPGWYIDDRAYRKAGGEVWILNETAFSKWVRKEDVRLRPDEVALLASRIEAHARSQSQLSAR